MKSRGYSDIEVRVPCVSIWCCGKVIHSLRLAGSLYPISSMLPLSQRNTCGRSPRMEGYCRALCPCGLTYLQFGMVSEVGNDVGLTNYIFLYNTIFSANSVIFSLGSLASLTVALSWGVPNYLAGAQQLWR